MVMLVVFVEEMGFFGMVGVGVLGGLGFELF